MPILASRLLSTGELILYNGQLDEVTQTSISQTQTDLLSAEFDEVNLGIVAGVVKREWSNGNVSVGGFLNEAPNEIVFSVPGIYTWTAPQGVTSVSVVCVGGGGSGGIPGVGGSSVGAGGGGGGLGYKNNIAVNPGQSYTVVVGSGGPGVATNFSAQNGNNGQDSYFISLATVKGSGGGGGTNTGGVGGTYTGDGGGSGGTGGIDTTTVNESKGGGGGGAGGYAGNGGTGGNGQGDPTPGTQPTSGSGGAGAGGAAMYGTFNGNGNAAGAAGGGGGVGLYGQGSNGVAPSNVLFGTNPPGGGGGSGGYTGGTATTGFAFPNIGGSGGLFGGGSGGATGYGQGGNPTINTLAGGNGAVRIIWSYAGTARAFPSTNAGILNE